MNRPHLADVVVVLPGVTGSILRKHGKSVWEPSPRAVWSAVTSLGRNIQDLRLDEDPQDVDDLGDGVVATGLIQAAGLLPRLRIEGYSPLADHLVQRYQLTRGSNFFEFAYDWRRDNRVAARRLKRESRQWLERWREVSGNADAKLVLVGHSMGGLVARYFVEVLGGWRDTRTLVTIGTPHRGSLDALETLLNPYSKAAGLLDLSELVRSFTSMYQLLPIYRCYDRGDGVLSYLTDAADDLPEFAREPMRSARAFHQEIADAVQANQEVEEYRRRVRALRPFIGVGQPTMQSAVRHGSQVKLLPHHDGEDWSGDGTVPRVSATPIELGNTALEAFGAARHSALHNAGALLTQLDGEIESLALDLDKFRSGAARRSISLDVADCHVQGETATARAKAIVTRMTPGGDYSQHDLWEELRVRVIDLDTGEALPLPSLFEADDGWWEIDLAGLPPGAYRLAATDVSETVEPVTELFAVYPPAQ